MWEEHLQKRMLAENFVAHITTSVVYKDGADQHEHAMFKVLFEEHGGQKLKVKCYLMYDYDIDNENSPPYKRISWWLKGERS